MKSQLCRRCNKPPGRMKQWKRRVFDDELEIYKAFIRKKKNSLLSLYAMDVILLFGGLNSS
jgi:hypothetical protein